MRTAPIVLVVLLPVAAGLGFPDPAGDAGEADFDLLHVEFEETAEHLRFTITVAGSIRPAVQILQEYEIDFRVVPGDLYQPDGGPRGLRHIVDVSNWETYIVTRLGSGYALPIQPTHGSSSATWSIPKTYLDTPYVRRPMAGDWLEDIHVRAMDFGVAADEVEIPDIQLARDWDAGPVLFLRRDGTLTLQPPTEPLPAAAPTALGPIVRPAWVSTPLAEPLALAGLGAHLWMSATTTTPFLADEDFRLYAYAVAPDGTRTRVAVREEEVTNTINSFTNLFLVPGVPQRMPFALAPWGGATEIAAGDRVELEVGVGGFLTWESGPVVVFHDGGEYVSALAGG